jgi:hypothetical protein
VGWGGGAPRPTALVHPLCTYLPLPGHHRRIPVEYWRDRLERLAGLGLNAIQLYVPWNFHEQEQGQFDFAGGWAGGGRADYLIAVWLVA